MLKLNFVEFAVKQGKEQENSQSSASLKHGRGFSVGKYSNQAEIMK